MPEAKLLVNIDVPEIAAAETFYARAFGLHTGRRFGPNAVELIGLPVPLYLLRRVDGTLAGTAGDDRARYDRHWTPVHLDVAVDDLDAAVARAVAAGASVEKAERDAGFGRISTLSDPWGHGFCFIQFGAEGYDAIAA